MIDVEFDAHGGSRYGRREETSFVKRMDAKKTKHLN